MAKREYYVFDLDHTLGDFNQLGEYILFLQPHKYNPKPTSFELTEKLQKAYDRFVEYVALHWKEIGLFNPEILNEVIERILKLPQSVDTRLAIYSNNADDVKLQFVQDVLSKIFKVNKLFQFCLGWTHPLRKGETVEDSPGDANKTWGTLKKAISVYLEDPNVEPSQVWFFDDLVHPDLVQLLPPDADGMPHYVLVKAYHTHLNHDIVLNGFLIAIEESRADEEDGYYTLLEMKPGSFYSIIQELSRLGARAERAKNSRTRKAGGGGRKGTKKQKRRRKSI